MKTHIFVSNLNIKSPLYCLSMIISPIIFIENSFVNIPQIN